MAGQRHNPGSLRLAGLALSLGLHAALVGVGVVLPPVGASETGVPRRSYTLSGPTMSLDWAKPPVVPPEKQSLPPDLVAVKPPEPVPTPPRPEPEPQPLKLGIAESSLTSDNWIGFNQATEHKAHQSSVEQPAMDPDAGMPGAPGSGPPAPANEPTPPSPPSPPAPTAPTAVATPSPTPTNNDPATTAQPVPPTAAAEPNPLDLPERTGPLAETPPPDNARAGEPMTPREPAPDASATPPSDLAVEGRKRDPVLPLNAPAGESETGDKRTADEPQDQAIDPSATAVVESFPSPRLFTVPLPTFMDGDAASSVPLRAPTFGIVTTTPGVDDRQRAEVTAAAPSPLQAPLGARSRVQAPTTSPTSAPSPSTPPSKPAPSVPPPGGEAGARVADKSPKEASPTSLEETIEVRLGKPAAAQGLEIFTRRPHLTSLTVVTSNPRNPLVRVTFASTGDVLDVETLESSGVKDVDDPVINAVYLWTAKGAALKKIQADTPQAGLKVTVRILLR